MIDHEKLMGLRIPDTTQAYDARDVMLYALGLGFGCDPLNQKQLAFVYEKHLRVVPTMALVLAYPGFWTRDYDTGIAWEKVVHGEQSLVLHRPLAPCGTVVGRNRVIDVIDKGKGRGALIYFERTLFDEQSGHKLATATQVAFCRGDGGYGGPERLQPKPHKLPDREPDFFCDLQTYSQQALLYRLSGDYNPLHSEPAAALTAGYDRPILHGLATFGMACHAVLRTACDYRSDRMRAISGRFTSPVYPGETLRTEIWQGDNAVSFQVRALERNVVAMSNGVAEIGE